MNETFVIVGSIIVISSFLLSLILFKLEKYSYALIATIVCLVWIVLLFHEIHTPDVCRVADFNQENLGVVRVYDYDGNLLEEYDGNLIIEKEKNDITMIEVEGNKIITFNEDGEIEVKEK